MNEVITEERHGLTIKIIQDDESGNGDPLKNDNPTEIVCLSLPGVGQIGNDPGFSVAYLDECGDYENPVDALREEILSYRHVMCIGGVPLMAPVYYYHANWAPNLSTRPPGEHVGWVFVTVAGADMCGLPMNPWDALTQDVENYNDYLQGEVYGYTVSRTQTCDLGHVHVKVLDSCWGYLGTDTEYVLDEAREAADYIAAEEGRSLLTPWTPWTI